MQHQEEEASSQAANPEPVFRLENMQEMQPRHSSFMEDKELMRPALKALQQGDKNKLKNLISAHEELVCEEDSHGNTLVHHAAIIGDDDMIEILHQNDATMDAKNQWGLQPLHLAAYYGHISALKILFPNTFTSQALVNVSVFNYKLQCFAVHLALLNNQVDAMRYLLQQQSKQQTGANHLRIRGIGNILHLAVLARDPWIVKTLCYDSLVLDSNDDLYNELNERDDTPLHLAIRIGNQSAVTILSFHSKVMLQTKSREHGYTALHVAAEVANRSAAKTIIRQFAHSEGAVEQAADHGSSANKFTAYHVALEKRDEFKKIGNSKEVSRYQLMMNVLSNFDNNAWHKLRQEISNTNLYKAHPIRGLICQGGGSTCTGFLRAIQEIGKQLNSSSIDSSLDCIERVAGTSGGGITVGMLALPLNPDQIEQEIDNLNYMDLLDDVDETKLALLKQTACELSDHPSIGNFLKTALKLIQSAYECKNNATALLHLIRNRQQIWQDLQDFEGLCTGKAFCDWLEDLVRRCFEQLMREGSTDYNKKITATFSKRKYTDLTMGDIAKLKSLGLPFKHLHIITCCISDGTPKLICINTEDPYWANVRYVDAIRATMSIPGVFKPHTFTFCNGEKTITLTCVDAGMFENCAIKQFDRVKYLNRYMQGHGEREIFNEEVRALRMVNFATPETLTPPEDIKQTSLSHVLKQLAVAYWEVEGLIAQFEQKFQWRAIEIDNLGFTTLSFNMSDKDKEALKASGVRAVAKAFGEYEELLQHDSRSEVLGSSASSDASIDIGASSGSVGSTSRNDSSSRSPSPRKK